MRSERRAIDGAKQKACKRSKRNLDSANTFVANEIRARPWRISLKSRRGFQADPRDPDTEQEANTGKRPKGCAESGRQAELQGDRMTGRRKIGGIASRLVALGFVTLLGVAARGQSAAPQNLSSAVGGGLNSVMVLDALGHIDVAWQSYSGNNGVVFTTSHDKGATFSTPKVLQGMIGEVTNLQMGTDAAGNITVLWSINQGLPDEAEYLSRSANGGMTFSTPKNLTTGAPGILATALRLAVTPDGVIEIAWRHGDIFFSKSSDGGTTFSPKTTVFLVTDDVADLRIAATGTQAYVFWSNFVTGECDILAGVSADTGTTFALPVNVSSAPGTCSLGPTPVLDANGAVDVTWNDTSGGVFFSRSTNGGGIFSPPVSVSSGTQFFSITEQQLAVDAAGLINVVWTAQLTDLTVLFARSNDNGATFSTPKIMSLPGVTNFTGGGNPTVGAGPCGDVAVAWADDSLGTEAGDFDIYLKRATGAAKTFSSAMDLSNSQNQAEVLTQMAVDADDNVYLSWQTTTSGANPNLTPNIFFRKVGAGVAQTGDFRLRVNPAVKGAKPGDAVRLVAVVQATGFRGHTVQLGCSNLPAFATCSFTPPAINTRRWLGVSTVTVNVPSTLPFGTYVFAVAGSDHTSSDSQTVVLEVSSTGNTLLNPEGPLPAAGAGCPANRIQHLLGREALEEEDLPFSGERSPLAPRGPENSPGPRREQ